MTDPKHIVPRDPAYLAFIREQPCLICGQTPSEAAHTVGQRGTGIKPTDYGCVPLCRLHHNEQHRIGIWTFADKYGYCYWRMAFELYHRFTTGMTV